MPGLQGEQREASHLHQKQLSFVEDAFKRLCLCVCVTSPLVDLNLLKKISQLVFDVVFSCRRHLCLTSYTTLVSRLDAMQLSLSRHTGSQTHIISASRESEQPLHISQSGERYMQACLQHSRKGRCTVDRLEQYLQ